VRVDVQDQGRGIPADERERVFDLFYQGDRHAGAVPQGLGLGLTLVKRLVEMHGGSVEVTSEGDGRGARFGVWLPVLDDAVAPPPPQPREPLASGPWRILVADDNRDSADSLAMLLQLDGHQVRVAYDGEQALESAADGWPQVALLDIGMPHLDGLQVAARLRARPGGRDLVLIAATGWGQEEDRRRSMTSGFDAHLVKPLEPAALLRVMASLTAHADLH
jgi:CheY-like chemotaxis protein